MTFAKRLAEVRQQAGFTQSSLARAVGMSQSAISQIESGERNPSYETIRQLARAMDLEPSYLVSGEVEGLSETEEAFFRQYRGLDEQARQELQQFARYLNGKSASKDRTRK